MKDKFIFSLCDLRGLCGEKITFCGEVMQYIKALFLRILLDLDWIITIVLSVVVAILSLFQKVPNEVLATTTLMVLGMLGFGALRDRFVSKETKALLEELKASNIAALYSEGILADRAKTGIERVISQTVHFDWLSEIQGATNVAIVKLKLNFTHDPEYYAAFVKILDKGGSVTIVLSDPRSPAMWLRYKEEPNPLWAPGISTQETAWIRGLEELAEEAYRLSQWKSRLIKEGKDVSKLVIKVFPHYPTHAFYKFDNKIYVYHYPYLERGFHAPAFLFSNPATDTHRFLIRCINSIIDNSLPLETEIEDIWGRYQRGAFSDQEVAKAEILVSNRASRRLRKTRPYTA
jgi:hypothetical protein